MQENQSNKGSPQALEQNPFWKNSDKYSRLENELLEIQSNPTDRYNQEKERNKTFTNSEKMKRHFGSKNKKSHGSLQQTLIIPQQKLEDGGTP